MEAQTYLINARVFAAHDPALQEALGRIYATPVRPRCLCVGGGVEMYVSKFKDFVIKRMPETGPEQRRSQGRGWRCAPNGSIMCAIWTSRRCEPMAKAMAARHSRRAAPKALAAARAARSIGGGIPAVTEASRLKQPRARRLEIVRGTKGAVTPKTLREMAHWDATRQVAQVRQGIPSAALLTLAGMLGLPLPELGRVVGIPGRTLHRRLDEPVLKSDESDRVLRVVKLLDYVADVLGSDQSARAWLREPNMALGRSTPLSLMDTEAGAAEVRRLIGRLDYGVYS